MLLALVACQLAVVLANPFHKYPFVFLLDIGNEELQNTKAEQIRLSVPGGSVALRYPAIGDGDTIAHVRASSIDFGTDLKVNIVDGGPGYKYVVFVLMGNPGAPYDAVVTIKTLTNSDPIDNNVGNVQDEESETQIQEENNELLENNSAEDLSDSAEVSQSAGDPNDESLGNDENVNQRYAEKTHAEIMDSSANVYAYAENEIPRADFSDNGDPTNEEDIHSEYRENIGNVEDDNTESKDFIDDDEVDQDGPAAGNKVEQYSEEDYDTDDNQEPVNVVDDNLYEKYQALKSHLYDGVKVYSQAQVLEAAKPIPAPFYDDNDPMELGQTFNDEEVHNDVDRFEDNNNNNNNYYYDNGDSRSAAY